MSSLSSDTTPGQGRLGRWDAISIIIGIVIGVTIYADPGLIFSFTLEPRWGLLVWIFGGCLALIGGSVTQNWPPLIHAPAVITIT